MVGFVRPEPNEPNPQSYAPILGMGQTGHSACSPSSTPWSSTTGWVQGDEFAGRRATEPDFEAVTMAVTWITRGSMSLVRYTASRMLQLRRIEPQQSRWPLA
jgi:hypothetical protein